MKEKWGWGEGIILFCVCVAVKAAHYPAVSGCMAPSQNIMMRINSPGTTSFSWRPSLGSTGAPPSNSFPPFPSSPFITDTLVFVPCHPLMGSSAAVAAYRPSLRLHFLHSLRFLSPCSPSLLLSVHLLKFPPFQGSSLLLLVLSPPPPFISSSPSLPSSCCHRTAQVMVKT